MKNPSQSASELKALIKRAIADLEITPAEYDEIMQMASDDGKIDKEEQALLSQFQQMIGNGTIERVRG